MDSQRRWRLTWGLLQIVVGVAIMGVGFMLLVTHLKSLGSLLLHDYRKGPFYFAAGCIGLGAAIAQWWWRRRQK